MDERNLSPLPMGADSLFIPTRGHKKASRITLSAFLPGLFESSNPTLHSYIRFTFSIYSYPHSAPYLKAGGRRSFHNHDCSGTALHHEGAAVVQSQPAAKEGSNLLANIHELSIN